MDKQTKPVVLILADISGYTQFMAASQETLVHGQMVITELLEAIIRETELPIEVQEIEGDAVFLYAVKSDNADEWEATRQMIGRKLPAFFAAFSRALLNASEFTLCPCAVCENIDKLKLKVVVHSGQALFHKVGRFAQVSGLDVILVHRLLKNSVDSDEYVLMSESAYRDINFVSPWPMVQGVERYEGIGEVSTYVFNANGSSAPSSEAIQRVYADRGSALRDAVMLIFRGTFAQFPILLGMRPAGKFNEFGDASNALQARPLVRFGLALRLLVMVPLVLPIGICVQAYRILSMKTLAQRHHH